MAKCRIFAIDDDLHEVVADGLYMKTMTGSTISVAVVKFVREAGVDLPAKAHSHGEEVSLQVTGGCSIFEVHDTGERETVMNDGDVTVIPAGLSHYGVNRFGGEGVSLRLNVVTPPRAEYAGGANDKPYYPLAERHPRS
ncbi:cupin [Burkholderia sp. MR1-5-21]